MSWDGGRSRESEDVLLDVVVELLACIASMSGKQAVLPCSCLREDVQGCPTRATVYCRRLSTGKEDQGPAAREHHRYQSPQLR